MLIAEHVTKDMRSNFIEEMRVMSTLRHPNVVLFMGASNKPPKMCIIMEFMALGSLYEVMISEENKCISFRLTIYSKVLHNELIPHLPVALKLKIALRAAKGMHYLHSSGIL